MNIYIERDTITYYHHTSSKVSKRDDIQKTCTATITDTKKKTYLVSASTFANFKNFAKIFSTQNFSKLPTPFNSCYLWDKRFCRNLLATE